MQIFVYILKCADGSFYTGITRRSVDERVSEHNQGLVASYTQSRRPVAVVYSAEFERIDEAIATERQIKGWSRAKTQALIDGDFQRLKELAAVRASDLILGDVLTYSLNEAVVSVKSKRLQSKPFAGAYLYCVNALMIPLLVTTTQFAPRCSIAVTS